MRYEFEDYRKPKKQPEIESWPFWVLPIENIRGYFIRFFLLLFILPIAFTGYLFTPTTTLVYWLIFDLTEYWKVKRGKGMFEP